MKKLLFSMLFLFGSEIYAAAHEDIFEPKAQDHAFENKRMAAILAIQQDKSDALKHLEELKKVDPEVVENLMDYALRSSGEQPNNSALVRQLSTELDIKHTGRSRSKSGTLSFLDVAIISGNLEGVKALLKEGVDTSNSDVLHRSEKYSALKTAEELHTKIKKNGGWIGVQATAEQMEQIVLLLREYEKKNEQPQTIVRRLSRSLSKPIRRRSKTNETT